MDDKILGSVTVDKNRQDGTFGIAFIPGDFGRGALGLIHMSEVQMLRFFADISLRPEAKKDALQNLETKGSCHITDLAVSRKYLQSWKLVD